MSGAGDLFYGTDQAAIHDESFGDIARAAAELLVAELGRAGHRSGTVVDLGCGSGILSARLAAGGYDVIGHDLSPAMVALARQAVPSGTFTVGSLHAAALPNRVVAVAAVGEALNYATDPRAGLDALSALAERVATALESGGIFLFDVSTPGRNLGLDVRRVLHDRDSWCLFMSATEDQANRTLRRDINIFREAEAGCYRRSREHHLLRLYERDDVVAAVQRAGLSVDLLSGYAGEPTSSTPPEGWVVALARCP